MESLFLISLRVVNIVAKFAWGATADRALAITNARSKTLLGIIEQGTDKDEVAALDTSIAADELGPLSRRPLDSFEDESHGVVINAALRKLLVFERQVGVVERYGRKVGEEAMHVRGRFVMNGFGNVGNGDVGWVHLLAAAEIREFCFVGVDNVWNNGGTGWKLSLECASVSENRKLISYCESEGSTTDLCLPPLVCGVDLVIDPVLAATIDPVSLRSVYQLFAVRRVTVELVHQLEWVMVDNLYFFIETIHVELKQPPLSGQGEFGVDDMVQFS